MMSKVILFGIDGGSLKLIEQWKDELPTFKRIMKGGVFGELLSTVPALTCPAWPCMFTGKNPGKLGMYDFLSLELNDEREPRVFSSLDYHSSSLWKILNEYGKKVGLLNVPMTFPPHKIDSFVVCGLGTPQTAGVNYTCPAELGETLNELVGGYEIIPSIILTLYGQEEKCLKKSKGILKKRVKAAEYLMDNFPWDLFVCVFSVLDVVQHYFWRYMDTSHPKHIANSKYKDVIKDFYKRIDEAIETLISEISEDTNILIASDHGFGPYYGGFSVNKWLEENGYLKFKHSAHRKSLNAGLREVRDFLLPRLSPKLVRLVAKVIPQGLANRLTTRGESKDKMLQIYRNIEWAETKAYALGMTTGGIFINLKGREPGGVVEPGKEYEKFRDEIIDKLSKVADPKTGEPLSFHTFKREEVHWGQYANLAPDISIELGSKYYPTTLSGESLWIEYAASGSHVPQGMFMAYGPDIKKEGMRLADLKIYDISPTILHIFGLPIPDDMDGRVLIEIFKAGTEPAKRAVVYQKASEMEKIKGKIKQLKASGRI